MTEVVISINLFLTFAYYMRYRLHWTFSISSDYMSRAMRFPTMWHFDKIEGRRGQGDQINYILGGFAISYDAIMAFFI